MTMNKADHSEMNASELAAFSMILSSREENLAGPESVILRKGLREESSNNKFSSKFQELVNKGDPPALLGRHA